MSKHTITATVGMGDPDIGAEVELEITFEYRKGSPAQGATYSHGGLPADPDEVEFLSCVGPTEGDGYDKHRQGSYDLAAENWLEHSDNTLAIYEQIDRDSQ